MADKDETLPEPDFRLKWRDGAYYVTKPNIGDTDCYTASTLREAIKGALENVALACEGNLTGTRMERDSGIIGCIQLIRAAIDDGS